MPFVLKSVAYTLRTAEYLRSCLDAVSAYICMRRQFDTVAETCLGTACTEATLTSEYAGFGGEKGVETGHR